MYNIVFVIVFFLFTILSFSQVIIKVENDSGNKAVLFSLEGEKVSFIDWLTSNGNTGFSFSLYGNHPGIYRLEFNNKKWLDFVYDNEEIEIETDINNIPENIKVLKSESNEIYYDFIKLNKEYKTKTELLQLILARYPGKDDYYITTKQKLIQIREDHLNFINITSQKKQSRLLHGI